MDAAELRRWCLAQAGAIEDFPFRPDVSVFKVVDVMTRNVLAEGADLRTTVDLLAGIRSIVDVSIYVWEPKAERWQQLSQREARMLWGMRDR